MDERFLALAKKKRQVAYDNPESILKKYDHFLEANGIYHSINSDIFKKSIKGRTDLSEDMLALYSEAKLENERIMLLEDLLCVGYDKDELVEMILRSFDAENSPSDLWEYADLLYTIKNYRYIPQYLQIIRNTSYGTARQMIVLLVGKCKKREVVPILIDLLNDTTVFGHALDALSNFDGEDILGIMRKYADCRVAWVRDIAKKYLSKHH